VKLGGRKSIRSFQQADADRANNDTPFEVITQGSDIIIRTNQDRVQDSMRISGDLEITVPKNASIEAHGRYGDFDISELGGAVEIK